MHHFDPAWVRAALLRLDAEMNPPLPDTEVTAFEHQHGITLPADYRRFLAEVGNGGDGPHYGVFPLGYFDAVPDGVQPWGDFIGSLAAPFPHHDPWNDLAGFPADTSGNDRDDEFERALDAFEERYWAASLMNGAFPICHVGCALRVWLVVSGDETGHLWYDRRADYHGLAPVLLKDGSRATFGAWYTEWLEGGLAVL